MKKYLQEHLNSAYFPEQTRLPGLACYENRFGWHDFYVGGHLVISHRKTAYDSVTFPEKLHSHDFYEVVIYADGNISYVAENREITPIKDNIIVLPPNCQHTSRMMKNSVYERYVFYFKPEFLDFLGTGYFEDVFRYKNASCLAMIHNRRAEFYYVRERLMDVLHSEEPDAAAQALCYTVQLLLLISQCTKVNKSSISDIPQKVLDIKHYVDSNFQTLLTTGEVADHFYYSREYVSRIFKQHYNINLSEYLMDQKINYAKYLLDEGNSVSFSCGAVGFKSASAFIKAFRTRTNMAPAEYKMSRRKK